jgi:ABC-type lipoprotein release transport system permease subunit
MKAPAGLGRIAAMALRNLGRHRTKTVITALAVAVSVALYIFMDGWILGMNLESRRNIVSYETGAAKVQSEAYFAKKDELPMYESFAGWERMAEALSREGYDAAPRFVFTGTLYSGTGSAPILFNAVDPARERKVLRYANYVEAGRFPEPGRLELAVGAMAAEKLRVGIPMRPTTEELEGELVAAARSGEEAAFICGLYRKVEAGGKAKMFARTDAVHLALEARRLSLRKDATREELARLWSILAAAGRMDVRLSTVIDMKAEDGSGRIRHVNQLIDAVVVGMINSPDPMTNYNVAYMPMDSLQDEAGLMLQGRVTELLVRRSGADDSKLPGNRGTAAESPEAIRAALERALESQGALPPGIAVHGWIDYAADYVAASNGDRISTRIMIIMLFVLSFIGIANTMLMSILERTKETGMLRALGMTDAEVLLAYAIEAGCIGAIGSIVGTALGCLINMPMVAYGIDYSEMAKEAGGDFGYRIAALFRSAWNPPVIALTGVAATLVSAAAAIPPSLRALRMPVTESLRFE